MKTTKHGRISKGTYGKIGLLFLIICLFALCAPLSYPKANQRKNVLVLHSYHQGLGWTDRITQGIESALHITDQEIDLHFEYMDAKRTYDEQHLQNLRELYRHKYRNHRFDVIISSDDHAFRFLLAHHQELFPDTPIVFCGVNDFKDSMLVGYNLITGVVESFDIKSTIDVALQLHPNAKEVFVIVDKTLSGRIVKEMVTKAIPYFKDVLKFSFLEDLDMSEVLERVKNLSNESIVFLISLLIDKSGNFFTFENSCALISQKSAVPIYSHSDAYLGHGIVGGMLNFGDAQGQMAGDMASRILHGEEVNNIPVVTKSPNRYMFDYQQMQRFGIKPGSLPEGSIVINRPHSFYSEHKGLIWSAIVSIAGLVLIIVILSVNIAIRRRAEEALRESEEKFRLLTEQNLLGIVILQDGLVRYVNKAASEITEYSIEEALEWKVDEFAKLFHPDNLEFVMKQAQKKQTGDKDITIHYSYRIITKSENVKWVDQYSKTITFAGKNANLITIIDITERRQAEEALRESESQKKAILDASVDRIRLTDKDGRIIWANQTHTRNLNIAPEDIVGKACYEVFVGRNTPCPECPTQEALRTGKIEHTVLVRPVSVNTDEKMYLDAYAVPIKDESGRIVNILQVTRDITEQVVAEKRLRESEEKYRELTDSITDVFFAMDNNLRYTFWNKASEELTGIAEKDVIGKSLFEIFSDSPETRKVESAYREVLKTRKSKAFINEYHIKGKRCFFDIAAYPSRDGLSVFVRDITKQKELEYELWESEVRYRSLFNGVPVGLYRTTPNGKILDANPALVEIMGYPNRETLVHANAIELYVNPKDSEIFRATVERQGAIYDFETQLYDYDGTPVWVGINARVVKNADGNILYYEGSMTDITERKMTEKALKESEERYKLLSENVPVILYSALSDETSTNLFISGKVEELTGYSDKQFIENPELYSAIIYPDDKAYVWEKIEEHRKKKILLDVEYRIITKGNGVKWIRDNANPIFNEEKEIIRIDGFMEDITDRKQAQEALIENGNRFRELFNNMSSGVAVYEPINDGSDFMVKDYNQAGELISKVNKEHIVGRSALEVFPGIKQFGLFEVLQRVWKTGESEHHPVSLYQDDYLTHWAENYVYKLPSGEIVAVFDDVTERVQAEEELRCSQEQLRSLADHLQTVREDERTSIAREIHDELGQALTGLKMDLSWMAKKIPEDQKSLLDKVHSMSELTGTTLRTVQRISTELRPGLLDDLGLVAAAEWQIEEFQNRTGIRCTLIVDPEDITADDRRSTALFRILQEALTNLVRHAQATRVHVSLKEKGKHLELIVRDNGKGITKEQISNPKSFGLIGIKERVHLWGGEVKISGRPGKGTTVVVRMPIEEISRKGAKDAK